MENEPPQRWRRLGENRIQRACVCSEAATVDPRRCVSVEIKYGQSHRNVVTQRENTAARESTGADKWHFLAVGDQSYL